MSRIIRELQTIANHHGVALALNENYTKADIENAIETLSIAFLQKNAQKFSRR